MATMDKADPLFRSLYLKTVARSYSSVLRLIREGLLRCRVAANLIGCSELLHANP